MFIKLRTQTEDPLIQPPYKYEAPPAFMSLKASAGACPSQGFSVCYACICSAPLVPRERKGEGEAPTGALTQEICSCAHVGRHWDLRGLLQRI